MCQCICMLFMCYCDMWYAWFRVSRDRTSGSIELGLEGPQRELGLEGPTETHWPEGQQSYSLECLIYVLDWYFRELTKLLCLQCYVLCVSGTSDDREKASAWFVHTHGILCISILGNVLWNRDMIQWDFINNCEWKMCFENVKICFNFYGVTNNLTIMYFKIKTCSSSYLAN